MTSAREQHARRLTASLERNTRDLLRYLERRVGTNDAADALSETMIAAWRQSTRLPDDDAEGARDYADELDLGDPLGTAGDKVWLDYAAREPPVVVLLGPGGTVLRGWPGGVEAAVLDRELEKLTAR